MSSKGSIGYTGISELRSLKTDFELFNPSGEMYMSLENFLVIIKITIIHLIQI